MLSTALQVAQDALTEATETTTAVTETTTAVTEASAQGAQDAVSAGASIGSLEIWVGLAVLLLFVGLLLSIAWWRSWKWNDPKGLGGRLRGLALPNGSVRATIAILVVGGFILFAFFGKGVVGDNQQFTAILGAWITLTGTVSGFYFGARAGQTLPSSITGSGDTPTFSSGTGAPPTFAAPDGSVHLSTGPAKRVYVRRSGAWVDVGIELAAEPTSVSPETGVDLAPSPPGVASTKTTANAYIVAENAAGDTYRLARYTGTDWMWEGAAFSKT